MKMYDIPILLICFKRYEKTLEVFKSIKSIKPKRLYIAIDGPRSDEESILVDKVASIFNDIDWDCTVKVRKSDTNQGCKYGVFNAINWFFSFEELGIILEDDIVPFHEFYVYMEDMLNRYKDDDRIACISGWSYFYKNIPENYEYSYYFSHVQSSWGWGTWKKKWVSCDIELKNTEWSTIEENLIKDGIDSRIVAYYKRVFNSRYILNSTWDYQFMFSALMSKNRYCVQPIYRYVKNIGVGDGATHPTDSDQNKSERVGENYKIKHPSDVRYFSWLDNERNRQTMEYI